MSSVQDIMFECTDYLRRIIALVGGQGGVTMSLEEYVWWVSWGKSTKGWCAICVNSIPPNTENWLRKLYDKNFNNDTSNEDKHETNYSMNNGARNMHIT